MKRTKKSQNRAKSLFIMIVLMAILSITATYAWFSTQRDVEIVGLRLNVEVAESLQISLDGETWVQSINIENMRQLYGTYGATGKHQANTTNSNYVPTELLPVSSDGTATSGKLNFVIGDIDGTTLKNVTACSEATIAAGKTVEEKEAGENNKAHPYLVFDMYLRNVSAKAAGQTDPLKLDRNSRVWVDSSAGTNTDEGPGKLNTGLENSARVGFVLYSGNLDINAVETGGKSVGEQVRELAPAASEKVAIWEPNYLEHTSYVISNDTRVSSLIPDEMGGTNTTATEYTGYITKPLASSTSGDVSNVASAGTAITTFRSEYLKDGGSVTEGSNTYTIDAWGTKTPKAITYTDGNTLGLEANKISKVRVYVWLEGQDPDCVDMASTAGRLDIKLKFMKDATTGITKPSYTGGGVTTP